MGNINKTISYNMGETVLFDKIYSGENLLILHDGNSCYQRIFHNLIKQVNNSSSILLYAGHKSNQISSNINVQTFFFNILTEEVIHELNKNINKYFDTMEKENKKMFLFADWSKANLINNEVFFPFLESLNEKSKRSSPRGWKKKYNTRLQRPSSFMMVNVLDPTNLQATFLQQAIHLHSRICLLQENSSLLMLPCISPSFETIFPKQHVLPTPLLEKLVKNNLDLIVLLFLEKENKSGYQILREIAQHFHCVLSQGTLYPLLYQLEKRGELIKYNGKGREVVYSLSKKTKNELLLRKEIQLKAYQHLVSFFE